MPTALALFPAGLTQPPRSWAGRTYNITRYTRMPRGGHFAAHEDDRGQSPYYRGGELDFLNRAIRRAELDHPELTNECELYFHALDDAPGLQLPQRDIQEGTVRAARWAPGRQG